MKIDRSITLFLNYIGIHENAAALSDAKWRDSYGKWTHIQTVEQIAEEYYGAEELILLIPEWYAWVHEDLEY